MDAAATCRLVKDQVGAIEGAHRLELAEGKQPLVDQLVRLRATDPGGILVREVVDWRHFSNRCELASSVGLVPAPHAGGSIEREQGISKAGNRRVRAVLVEQG